MARDIEASTDISSAHWSRTLTSVVISKRGMSITRRTYSQRSSNCGLTEWHGTVVQGVTLVRDSRPQPLSSCVVRAYGDLREVLIHRIGEYTGIRLKHRSNG